MSDSPANNTLCSRSLRDRIAAGGWKLPLASVLITVLMAAVFWMLCPPQFTETNDDAVMSWFVYGYYGEYCPYLCFINVIIGYAIIFCLHIAPTIAWYTVFQLTIVLVSATVLNYLILKRLPLFRAVIALVFLYVFFGGDIFSKLQFTKTAGLGLISGSLLLFEACAYAEHYRVPKAILGCVLILLGSLYRFKTTYVIFALMLGVGCWLFAETLKDHNWKRFFRTLLPFLGIFAICCGCRMYDTHAYQSDPDWAEYKELNPLRVSLTNLMDDAGNDSCWPNYEENEAVYMSLGITYNDFQLFQSSNYAYEPLLNADAMQTLVDCKPAKQYSISYFISMVKVLLLGFMDYDFLIAMILAVLWSVFCFIDTHDWKKLLLPIYELGMLAVLESYLYIRGRYLQRRVDVVLTLAVVMVLMLYSWNRENAIAQVRRKAAVTLASLALVALNISHLYDYRLDRYDQSSQAYQQQELRDLVSTDQDHFYLYIYNWTYYPDKCYDAFTIYEKGHYANTSPLGNWRIITPTVQDQLAAYGITDCYGDMLNNDTVYLIGVAGNTNVDHVQELIRAHYDETAIVTMVKQVGIFGVYRITTGELVLDTSEAVEAPESLQQSYLMSYKEKSGRFQVYGDVYLEGENSFASNFYLALADKTTGEVSYNYVCQYADGTEEDNLNGRYGTFSASMLTDTDRDYEVTLYMECGDVLYEIPLDDLSMIRLHLTEPPVTEDSGTASHAGRHSIAVSHACAE